ncbi:MAG: ATPase, T2SS/T4P/T4SS family, partial [Bradymonadaceae bacterium]
MTAPPEADSSPIDIPKVVRSVPRDRFIDPELHHQDDGSDDPSDRQWQGIPPDQVVVQMLQALGIDGGSQVLEFGTGLGFTAAILGEIADKVYTVGRGKKRRQSARERLQSMGVGNVELLPASNYRDRLPNRRFDAILVSVPNANPPKSLVRKLTPNGKLVVLLESDESYLKLAQVTRSADGTIQKRSLGKVPFSFRLGDILVDLEAATRSQVERAARHSAAKGHPIGHVLLETAIITEDQLYEALALQHGLEVGDLEQLGGKFDIDLVESVSASTLQHSQILPMRRDDDRLAVVSVDPDPPRRRLLELFDAERLDVYLVGPTTFRRLWDDLDLGDLPYWRPTNSEDTDAQAIDPVEDVYSARLRSHLQTILSDAARERASRIHLECSDDSVRVRFRIDGVLQEIDFYSLSPAEFDRLVDIVKVQADLTTGARDRPKSGQFERYIGSSTYRFRVHTKPTVRGENLVIDVRAPQPDLLSIDELDLPDEVADRYRRHLDQPSGLALLVGPSDSGITTSMYTGLRYCGRDWSRKVITIEDPVEYDLEGIDQTNIDEDLDFTYPEAIESLLRRDPDVLAIGEIDDRPTARRALAASRSGCLVLATMHASDTAEAIRRLLDFELAPDTIAAQLAGVFAQRLARRVCHGCREQSSPSPSTVDRVFPDGMPHDLVCYDGSGCVRCRGRGRLHRVGFVEYLRVGPEIRRAIGRAPLLDDLRRRIRESGVTTLKAAGLRLVRDGSIPLSELPR